MDRTPGTVSHFHRSVPSLGSFPKNMEESSCVFYAMQKRLHNLGCVFLYVGVAVDELGAFVDQSLSDVVEIFDRGVGLRR